MRIFALSLVVSFLLGFAVAVVVSSVIVWRRIVRTRGQACGLCGRFGAGDCHGVRPVRDAGDRRHAALRALSRSLRREPSTSAGVVLHGQAPPWRLTRRQYDYPIEAADLLMVHPLTPDLESGYADVTADVIAVYRYFLAEQSSGFDFWQPMVREMNYGASPLVPEPLVALTRGRR